MNMDKIKKYLFGAGVLIGIVGVTFILIMSNSQNIKLDQPVVEDEPEWHEVWSWTPELGPLGAEASQAGTSGFLGIYFVNHSATAATAYTRNASTEFENWSHAAGLDYCNSDNFRLELAANTQFDIVVRVVYVDTNGPWNGTAWRDTDVRINITVTGEVSISDVTGTFVETHNVSTDKSYYGNVYWTGGSGYSIAAGDGTDQATISEISIEARY